MSKSAKKTDDYIAVLDKKYKKLRIGSFASGLCGGSDQSVAAFNSATDTYNFDFSSGALKCGIGIEDAGLPVLNIVNIWRFVKNTGGFSEILMFSGIAGDVYYLMDGVQPLGIKLEGKIFSACYNLHGNDIVLMCSGDKIAVWDGVNPAYFIADSEGIESVDICGGLAFIAGSDGQTVKYTDELDPINWNSGYQSFADADTNGYISTAEIAGGVGRIVSFAGYLYIFKDFGIIRVSLSGGQPKPVGSCALGGRIIFDTVAICGNKIMFLSSDGLYEFDGLNAKRVLKDLTGLSPAFGAVAAALGERYFLAVRYAFKNAYPFGGCEAGQYTNNAVITYLPTEGAYTISRGMDIGSMTACESSVYVVTGGKAGRLASTGGAFGTLLAGCWTSPLSDLGSEKTKFLRQVEIETEGDITLTVFNGTESKSVEVKGAMQPQSLRIALRGKKLGFSITARAAAVRVCPPIFIYSEM